MARTSITIHAKLRGVMHGVGHAGDRILENVKMLEKFTAYVKEGPRRKLYTTVLSSIRVQAEQLKTTKDKE